MIMSLLCYLSYFSGKAKNLEREEEQYKINVDIQCQTSRFKMEIQSLGLFIIEKTLGLFSFIPLNLKVILTLFIKL